MPYRRSDRATGRIPAGAVLRRLLGTLLRLLAPLLRLGVAGRQFAGVAEGGGNRGPRRGVRLARRVLRRVGSGARHTARRRRPDPARWFRRRTPARYVSRGPANRGRVVRA